MNPKIKILTVTLVILTASFLYYTKSNSVSTSKTASVNKIEVSQYDELAGKNDTFVVDVHTPEQDHLANTDALIPFNEIGQSNKLPEDKDTPILVYCRSGSMSDTASEELVNMGYTNVYDLVGGVQAYREQNVDVTVTPSTVDLGTVVYGDIAKTKFELTNNTPTDLEITRVSTSCTCTSAEVEETTLEAYESTIVYVSFDPAIHNDETDLGELTRTIYLDTDNPNFKQVTSTITANVIRKVGDLNGS